jgi:flagellar biosynthesis/type III secretory pathway protein FliH
MDIVKSGISFNKTSPFDECIFFDEGYRKGYKDGQESGYDVGYKDGHREGHSEGYDSGFENGSQQGYEDGFSDGYNESEGDHGEYESGEAYKKGYQAAVNEWKECHLIDEDKGFGGIRNKKRSGR